MAIPLACVPLYVIYYIWHRVHRECNIVLVCWGLGLDSRTTGMEVILSVLCLFVSVTRE